jgi:hypothetical protein
MRARREHLLLGLQRFARRFLALSAWRMASQESVGVTAGWPTRQPQATT